MYKTFFLDEVQNDIDIAKKWYSEQQKDLDIKFVIAVKNTISRILKMPFAYAVRYRNVRIAHIEIFPYNIHFYIEEEKSQIVIIGIIHNKRKDALYIDK